jgi:hypothetical protein
MVEPGNNKEPPVVIVPLSGITTILPAGGLEIRIVGISIAASNANMPKLIMIAFFFTSFLLSIFP